ncbi:MAG: DUF1598 domain-containing protein, partial [Planctomycetaceae bacterium]|nr:DUF1598 domain-containing protein [Planctomycetaceae bacterium]
MQKILFRLLIFNITFAVVPCFADNDNLLRQLTGGVKVEADGTVRAATNEELQAAGQWLTSVMQPLPPGLAKDNTPADKNSASVLRKISLKKLDAAVRTVVEEKGEFSDAVRYLGGLTSIQYIVAVPDENDIILAGPAEGWTTDNNGNVIGKESRMPVLSLEDFLVLFRLWNGSEKQKIVACSFDLTQEAETKINQIHRDFTGISADNADAFAVALEQAHGNLQITLTGVAATSRLAKILVAADFKMKQYALGLEPAPVRTLPSYASLITDKSPEIPTRFYLTAEYAQVLHDSAKLTWQLGETPRCQPKVKVLTEYDYQRGRITPPLSKASVRPDRAAMNWSSKFETQYDAIAKKQPVFNVLKDNMHLALAAALIHQEQLLRKANCPLPMLSGSSTADRKLRSLNYPKPLSVPSRSAVTKNGYATVVVCGGIEINPVAALQKSRLESKIDKDRS